MAFDNTNDDTDSGTTTSTTAGTGAGTTAGTTTNSLTARVATLLKTLGQDTDAAPAVVAKMKALNPDASDEELAGNIKDNFLQVLNASKTSSAPNDTPDVGQSIGNVNPNGQQSAQQDASAMNTAAANKSALIAQNHNNNLFDNALISHVGGGDPNAMTAADEALPFIQSNAAQRNVTNQAAARDSDVAAVGNNIKNYQAKADAQTAAEGTKQAVQKTTLGNISVLNEQAKNDPSSPISQSYAVMAQGLLKGAGAPPSVTSQLVGKSYAQIDTILNAYMAQGKISAETKDHLASAAASYASAGLTHEQTRAAGVAADFATNARNQAGITAGGGNAPDTSGSGSPGQPSTNPTDTAAASALKGQQVNVPPGTVAGGSNADKFNPGKHADAILAAPMPVTPKGINPVTGDPLGQPAPPTQYDYRPDVIKQKEAAVSKVQQDMSANGAARQQQRDILSRVQENIPHVAGTLGYYPNAQELAKNVDPARQAIAKEMAQYQIGANAGTDAARALQAAGTPDYLHMTTDEFRRQVTSLQAVQARLQKTSEALDAQGSSIGHAQPAKIYSQTHAWVLKDPQGNVRSVQAFGSSELEQARLAKFMAGASKLNNGIDPSAPKWTIEDVQ